MLFNSHIFIFLFLPVTLLVFFAIGKRGHHKIAISWLVGASLFFYGWWSPFYDWWNPTYLILIVSSILLNYATGMTLSSHKEDSSKKGLLVFGIAANLGVLGYFKYANFFVNNVNSAIGTDFHLETIILPLAISFFTFQQIAFLVDSYKGETQEPDFLRYCLFVTFFPQLIAGPIVHHKEMIPQYTRDRIYSPNQEYLATGLTIFVIGLFKKVVLADGIAVYATPVFNAAEVGGALTFFEAWSGALAYTFQLYFDFSGYSDMAIGLGRMFGVRLPLNFNSPYKAKSIIEFWRCWHMTLSRFLKDYLYIPLGGNRKGAVRRYTSIMITMLLGGLWHGAGWTFIIWGALHGLYILVNHGWHALRRTLGHDLKRSSWFGRGTAQFITFTAIVVGWVFFRAETLGGATNMLSTMLGGNGISFDGMFSSNIHRDPLLGMGLILALLIISWYAPNSTEFVLEGSRSTLVWQPSFRHAVLIATIFGVSFFHLKGYSEFLYFQF